GQLALASLAGDDGRDPLVLQPAEQAAQFGPQDGQIRQATEQSLDGVQHYSFGPDAVDGVVQANEQSFEIVVARFVDLAAFDPHEVHCDFLALDEVIQVKAERTDILREFLGGFLKGHENARFLVLGRTANNEFHCEKRFAATGATANQSRSTAPHSAARSLCRSVNTTEGLRKTTIERRRS